MAKGIVISDSFGAIVDYQDFFLAQVENRARSKLRVNTRNFVRLLGYFRIPLVVTLERPVYGKGAVPKDISAHLTRDAKVFEKDFFDLSKEKKIRDHIARLKRKQVIMVGCETDVCVLQSCLGCLRLGYEVFVVEELVFSSARNVDAALARMQAAGAVVLSYKTLYYELIEAVEGNPHTERMLKTFGAFPDDLPDDAVR